MSAKTKIKVCVHVGIWLSSKTKQLFVQKIGFWKNMFFRGRKMAKWIKNICTTLSWWRVPRSDTREFCRESSRKDEQNVQRKSLLLLRFVHLHIRGPLLSRDAGCPASTSGGPSCLFEGSVGRCDVKVTRPDIRRSTMHTSVAAMARWSALFGQRPWRGRCPVEQGANFRTYVHMYVRTYVRTSPPQVPDWEVPGPEVGVSGPELGVPGPD